MAKNQLNDFAATLTAQLKDAAQQLRTMRKPPVHNTEQDSKHEIQISEKPKKKKKSATQKTEEPKQALTKKDQSVSTSNQKTEIEELSQIMTHDYSEHNCHPLSVTEDNNQQQLQKTNLDIAHSNELATNTTNQTLTPISEKNQHLTALIQSGVAPGTPQSLHSTYKEYTDLQFSRLKNLIHTHTQNTHNKNVSSTVNQQTNTVHDHQLQSITHSEQVSQNTVPWGHYNPNALNSVRLSTSALGGARQLILDALIQLRNESPQVTINLKRLATVLGLSYGTVRNTVSRLVREGVIYTTQIRAGDVHGVYVEFSEMTPSLQSIAVTQHQPTLNNSNIFQEKQKTIWDTDTDTLALLWPHAVSAGLCPAHLELLKKAYKIQGFDDTHVAKYLRYINWKIETEALNDPVKGAHLLQQWLQVMQQKGQYPCPAGYIENTVENI